MRGLSCKAAECTGTSFCDKPPQSKLQNIQNKIIEKPTGNNKDGKVTFLGSQPYPHSSHMPFGETLKEKKKAKPSQPPSLKIKTKCTRAFCVTSMVEQCCQQLASQAFLLMPQCVKDIFNDRSRALLSVRCLSCVNSSLLGTQIQCPTREAVKAGRHHKAGEISVQTALQLSWLLLSYLQGISSEVSLNIFLLLLLLLESLCEWMEIPEMRQEEKYTEKGKELSCSYPLSLLR